MIIKYPKIETIYERDMEGTRELIPGKWRDAALEQCRDCDWIWTEKVDGTNIRVIWDGYKVEFRGRTDAAEIPKHLLEKLEILFSGETNAQIFEQMFGEKEVILFGEGYGPKIQAGGGLYSDEPQFILFDVLVGTCFLDFESIQGIAKAFGVDRVPVVGHGKISDAVTFVKYGFHSQIGEGKHDPEGIVCRLPVDLYDKVGRRLMVKIKGRDFKKGEGDD